MYDYKKQRISFNTEIHNNNLSNNNTSDTTHCDDIMQEVCRVASKKPLQKCVSIKMHL